MRATIQNMPPQNFNTPPRGQYCAPRDLLRLYLRKGNASEREVHLSLEHLTTRFLSTSVCQALWKLKSWVRQRFCLQVDYSLVTKQKTLSIKTSSKVSSQKDQGEIHQETPLRVWINESKSYLSLFPSLSPSLPPFPLFSHSSSPPPFFSINL